MIKKKLFQLFHMFILHFQRVSSLYILQYPPSGKVASTKLSFFFLQNFCDNVNIYIHVKLRENIRGTRLDWLAHPSNLSEQKSSSDVSSLFWCLMAGNFLWEFIVHGTGNFPWEFPLFRITWPWKQDGKPCHGFLKSCRDLFFSKVFKDWWCHGSEVREITLGYIHVLLTF